jgi:hypothetical protein
VAARSRLRRVGQRVKCLDRSYGNGVLAPVMSVGSAVLHDGANPAEISGQAVSLRAILISALYADWGSGGHGSSRARSSPGTAAHATAPAPPRWDRPRSGCRPVIDLPGHGPIAILAGPQLDALLTTQPGRLDRYRRRQAARGAGSPFTRSLRRRMLDRDAIDGLRSITP